MFKLNITNVIRCFKKLDIFFIFFNLFSFFFGFLAGVAFVVKMLEVYLQK